MPILNRSAQYFATSQTETEAGDLTPVIPPDVIIGDTYGDSIIKDASVVITFTFTQDISGLELTDIGASAGVFSNLSGEGDLWTALLTLPTNASGTTTITLSAESVANSQGIAGPVGDRTYTTGYDTRIPAFTNPVGSCVASYAFNDTANPFIDAAGVLQPPLEMVGLRRGNTDYIIAVVQVSPYSSLFEPQPGAPSLVAKAVNTQVQASAALVEVNLSTCTWRVIEKYPFISTAPRSLKVVNGEVFFFRGDYPAYYNAGRFKVIQNVDGEFYQSLGQLERKASATEAGQYQVLTSPDRLRILLDRDAADYADQKQALRTKDRLVIGERLIVRISNYAVVEAGAIGTFTVNYSTDGTLPVDDVTSPFRVNIGEYGEVYSKYRLRDLYNQAEYYNVDWKSQIGRLYKLDNTGVAITDLGINWVSSEVADDPNRDSERPYYEQTPKPDAFYGVHGGTASPIVHADSKLHLITGYGDWDKVADNDSEMARLANSQHVVYDTELSRQIVTLETNEKTAWDILKDAAILTNSYVAFDADTFHFKPKTPIQAKLQQAIPAQNYPSSSIYLKDLTRDVFPSGGRLLIDDEIFTYTGLQNGNPSPFTRATEGTTAAAHALDADVFYIDHIIEWDRYAVDPMDAINIENDTTQIYNSIKVSYGDKSYEVRDTTSIDTYGLRELDVGIPLDITQRNIAKDLAETYLAELKAPRQVVQLRLKLSLYLGIMDILLVRETDRSHLTHLMQVVSLDHQIFRNETSVTCVLIEPIG